MFAAFFIRSTPPARIVSGDGHKHGLYPVSMKWVWFILLKMNLHAGVVPWEWSYGGVMVKLAETGTDYSSAGWCRSNGSRGATEGLMQETISVVAALAETISSWRPSPFFTSDSWWSPWTPFHLWDRQGYRCLGEGWGNSHASDGVLKSPNNISKSVARILSQIALISSCIASNTVYDELRSGGI